jgi:hypothetical protein
MNYFLLICLIITMLGNIIRGLHDIQSVRLNPSLGVKPSKNIFTYLFID